MPGASKDFVLGPVRMPRALALLIGAILIVSVAAAVTARNAAVPLAAWLVLSPAAVLRGELWRLVTWPLLEDNPLSVLFACYALYWVGRDLVDAWGSQRFLMRALLLTFVTGVITTAASLAWPGLGAAGTWPMLAGLIVMWGLTFRGRTMHFLGGITLTGLRLAQVAVGITVLYALFFGLAPFVPHFVAEAIAFVWMGPFARRRTGPRAPKRQEPAQVFSFADWHAENNKNRKN